MGGLEGPPKPPDSHAPEEPGRLIETSKLMRATGLAFCVASPALPRPAPGESVVVVLLIPPYLARGLVPRPCRPFLAIQQRRASLLQRVAVLSRVPSVRLRFLVFAGWHWL